MSDSTQAFDTIMDTQVDTQEVQTQAFTDKLPELPVEQSQSQPPTPMAEADAQTPPWAKEATQHFEEQVAGQGQMGSDKGKPDQDQDDTMSVTTATDSAADKDGAGSDVSDTSDLSNVSELSDMSDAFCLDQNAVSHVKRQLDPEHIPGEKDLDEMVRELKRENFGRTALKGAHTVAWCRAIKKDPILKAEYEAIGAKASTTRGYTELQQLKRKYQERWNYSRLNVNFEKKSKKQSDKMEKTILHKALWRTKLQITVAEGGVGNRVAEENAKAVEDFCLLRDPDQKGKWTNFHPQHGGPIVRYLSIDDMLTLKKIWDMSTETSQVSDSANEASIHEASGQSEMAAPQTPIRQPQPSQGDRQNSESAEIQAENSIACHNIVEPVTEVVVVTEQEAQEVIAAKGVEQVTKTTGTFEAPKEGAPKVFHGASTLPGPVPSQGQNVLPGTAPGTAPSGAASPQQGRQPQLTPPPGKATTDDVHSAEKATNAARGNGGTAGRGQNGSRRFEPQSDSDMKELVKKFNDIKGIVTDYTNAVTSAKTQLKLIDQGGQEWLFARATEQEPLQKHLDFADKHLDGFINQVQLAKKPLDLLKKTRTSPPQLVLIIDATLPKISPCTNLLKNAVARVDRLFEAYNPPPVVAEEPAAKKRKKGGEAVTVGEALGGQ